MSLPYLPLYIDDYEAATAHLTMTEDGAYNRLLRLCWRSPGCKLPHDEAWIMRKMRAVTDAEQDAVRAVLAEFFTTGRGKIWSKRLLKVHVQKSVAHLSKVEAGKKGAAAKALKSNKTASSTAKAELKQPEPEPEPEAASQQWRDRDRSNSDHLQDPTDREMLLAAMGVGSDGITGPDGRMIGRSACMVEVAKWSGAGLSLDQQCAVIAEVCERERRKFPGWMPRGFGYFTQPMIDLAARKSRPLPSASAQHEQSSDRAKRKAFLRRVAGGTAA